MPPRFPTVTSALRASVLSLYVPTLLGATARGAALLLLPLYALEIGGGEFLAAAVVSLRATGTLLADVPSGNLISRLGDKSIMIIGLAIFAASSALTAVSTSSIALAGVSLGMGIGIAAWIMGRLANITETVRLQHRGRVISVLAGLERAGTLIGPLLAGFAVEMIGYPAVFVLIAIVMLVATAFCSLFAKRTPLRIHSSIMVGVRQVLAKFWLLFLQTGPVVIILAFLRNAKMLVVPIWGVAIGLDPSEIGLILSMSALVDLLMFVPAGLILDHIGRKATLIPCMLLLSLSLALLPFTEQFWTFMLVSLISGIGNGFGTGIFMTLGGDLAPRHGRSRFLGIWRFIGDSGGVAGPFAVGVVASSFSMITACMAAGGLGLLGVLLAVVFIPEPLRSRRI